MIQLSAAGKRFGHKLLFDDLDWLITPRERVGLVGANGSGKTTLMKVLAGLETLDYGAITVARGISSGYLPQDGLSLSGRTVFAECMSVFSGLRDMEREMDTLAHEMAEVDPDSVEYGRVADRFHVLQDQFRAHDGYALEAQVGTVLSGLGFARRDWERLTDEFSGGWQMRISLAKLLLQKPNLLLLDEPTNHLDLESRNWLEDYLKQYPFAYVLISHDRYFLDVTVDRIAEIWNKRVHFYPGNYDQYEREKQQRRAALEAAYRNQRERIEQLEAFINRFRYQATKAKQVQSRIKELEKIERIEIPPEEKTIHFKFPQPKPSGRSVAEFRDVAKSYGDLLVFSGANFTIERGDRVALVGVNGAGKSTLIRILAGLERLTEGEYKLGHNVEPDYFAQDQYKQMDPESRVLDDLWQLAPQCGQTEIRNILGSFLFSEDDVFKRIGVLSGGERNRYAIARMLLRPSNFLLMDEPTNHLDLRAKDVLLRALQDFEGTVVFVSHDRYFIDKLATRVFEVAERKVNVYPGNYEDYLWRKERDRAALEQEAEPATHVPSGEGREVPVTLSQSTKAKRINPIRLRQMQSRVEEIEQQIARLETGITECESALASFVSTEETQRQTVLLQNQKDEIAALMSEWEELSTQIEESNAVASS